MLSIFFPCTCAMLLTTQLIIEMPKMELGVVIYVTLGHMHRSHTIMGYPMAKKEGSWDPTKSVGEIAVADYGAALDAWTFQ